VSVSPSPVTIHEITDANDAVEKAVEFAMDGINKGVPVVTIMRVLYASISTWPRTFIIETLADARFRHNPNPTVAETIARLSTSPQTDTAIGHACAGNIVAAAYHKLGRFDEWEAEVARNQKEVRRKNGTVRKELFTRELVRNIAEIPADNIIIFAVTPCHTTRPGAVYATIECDTCPNVCWISPATARAYQQAQQEQRTTRITCAECIGPILKELQ
jgi:hypothetical protein